MPSIWAASLGRYSSLFMDSPPSGFLVPDVLELTGAQMQPTLLGEGVHADGARVPSAETGWASCWRAEPELDALYVIPRRGDVDDAARAWAVAPTFISGFRDACTSTVRPISP